MNKSQTLSVWLLAEGVGRFENALRSPGNLNEVAIDIPGTEAATLFIKPQADKTPAWVEFLEQGTADPLEITTRSASAVLFIQLARAGAPTFAVTFGFGRTLLQNGAYRRGFGLRVVLNELDTESVRRVDTRSLEIVNTVANLQRSVPSAIDEFGIDFERDLVRAISGRPGSQDYANRFSGSDSLSTTLPIKLADFAAKCEEFYVSYQKTGYRQRFDWADRIHPATPKALRDDLDKALVKYLNDIEGAGEQDRVVLSLPEVIDWEKIKTIAFDIARDQHDTGDSPTLSDYLNLVDAETLTLELLQEDHSLVITLEDGGVESKRRLPLFNALSAELVHNDANYILAESNWYEVERDFVDALNREIDELERRSGDLGFSLPDAKTSGEHEGDYNERVAAESNGRIAMMDRQLARSRRRGSSIEVCDLWHDENLMIHVKRGTSSSNLSHLFNQGLVSSELLADDPAYRDEARDLLPAGHKHLAQAGGAPFDPTAVKVVYAASTSKKKPLRKLLPFFSRLTLRNAVRRLSRLGFDVYFLTYYKDGK